MDKISEQFDFKDWEKCFKRCFELLEQGVEIQLVISTHQYSSGYWIENKTAPIEIAGNYFYQTKFAIKELYGRVCNYVEKERKGKLRAKKLVV